MIKLYLNTLDEKRQDVIPLLSALKNDFYLAGGTSLALMIGHRDSVDFDFFTKNSFDTDQLYKKLENIFANRSIKKIQEEKDTLTILVGDVKLSFFSYPYKMICPLIKTPDLYLASIQDIGCMKLSAITHRATIKDYVDLYFILKQIELSELLKYCTLKFPAIDKFLILKSLVYFDDVEKTPLKFMPGKEVSPEDLKRYFENLAKSYLKSQTGN